MVEYPIEEAKELLTEKITSQENSMKTCQEDLEFLREQITTMEVNIGNDPVLFTTDFSTNIQLGRKTKAGNSTTDNGWSRLRR